MDSMENIGLNSAPKVLVEESRNAIRARGFVSSNLKHSAFNFFISDKSV